MDVGLNAPFLMATVKIENTCVLPFWPEECGPQCKEFLLHVALSGLLFFWVILVSFFRDIDNMSCYFQFSMLVTHHC